MSLTHFRRGDSRFETSSGLHHQSSISDSQKLVKLGWLNQKGSRCMALCNIIFHWVSSVWRNMSVDIMSYGQGEWWEVSRIINWNRFGALNFILRLSSSHPGLYGIKKRPAGETKNLCVDSKTYPLICGKLPIPPSKLTESIREEGPTPINTFTALHLNSPRQVKTAG